MSVIMITELPGADAGFAEAIRGAGVLDAIAEAPGFLSHISGPVESGYRVIEVWDSREAHRSWYENHVAPKLPAGLEPTTPEYIELTMETAASV
jgi:heme-degrading monooxygenase HmoA